MDPVQLIRRLYEAWGSEPRIVAAANAIPDDRIGRALPPCNQGLNRIMVHDAIHQGHFGRLKQGTRYAHQDRRWWKLGLLLVDQGLLVEGQLEGFVNSIARLQGCEDPELATTYPVAHPGLSSVLRISADGICHFDPRYVAGVAVTTNDGVTVITVTMKR